VIAPFSCNVNFGGLVVTASPAVGDVPTVTVTVPVTLAPRSSVMVTENVSGPEKLSGGV